ncbi:hypothetical protein AA989_10655 [Enterococcus cecorum]|nr:hypothetical protein AA989_10655 [Enterococcus cecorum]
MRKMQELFMKNTLFSKSLNFCQDLLVNNRQLYCLFIKDFVFSENTRKITCNFIQNLLKCFNIKRKILAFFTLMMMLTF